MAAKGVLNFSIKYNNYFDVKLIGYSYLDWPRNMESIRSMDNRRSIARFAFNIGSGVISWSSKKKSIVSLLLAEAKYQVVCAATCEAIWLRRLLDDTGEEQKDAMIIKCDNQSSTKLENNHVFHKNIKHIDTHFHSFREKV